MATIQSMSLDLVGYSFILSVITSLVVLERSSFWARISFCFCFILFNSRKSAQLFSFSWLSFSAIFSVTLKIIKWPWTTFCHSLFVLDQPLGLWSTSFQYLDSCLPGHAKAMHPGLCPNQPTLEWLDSHFTTSPLHCSSRIPLFANFYQQTLSPAPAPSCNATAVLLNWSQSSPTLCSATNSISHSVDALLCSSDTIKHKQRQNIPVIDFLRSVQNFPV